jgi:4-nitrophenyl phosphatase
MRARTSAVTDIRGVVLDVDGTLVRGEQPIAGAATALERIERSGLGVVCLSNNPTKSAPAYAERLDEAGLDVAPEQILTAGDLTARWLAETHPSATSLVFGSEGLDTALSAQGCQTTTDPDEATVVVASHDRTFDYHDMETALHALADEDVRFVGTDPDRTVPTEDRPMPGSGAIIAAVAGVSGREPEVIVGKPSSFAREAALDRLGVPANACLVVGDRLDTDIALAEGTPMRSVRVRSGITDETVAEADSTPDRTLDSIADIGDVLDGLSC